MATLTCRRNNDPHRESWSIYYDDIGIGTIGKRSGVPTHVDQWRLVAKMRAFNRRIAVTPAGQATSLGKRVVAMPDSIDEKMAAHVEATIKLAEGILVSVNEDAYDAILKAVGTLAQVIFITARDEDREDVIEEATDKLRNYLGLLDELKGMGALVARPTLTVVK